MGKNRIGYSGVRPGCHGLLTLFFGIVEFSMAMYTSGFLAYGAQEGTRYSMVHGSDWTTACSSTTIYDCKAATTDVQNYILSLPHPGVNLQASNLLPPR